MDKNLFYIPPIQKFGQITYFQLNPKDLNTIFSKTSRNVNISYKQFILMKVLPEHSLVSYSKKNDVIHQFSRKREKISIFWV